MQIVASIQALRALAALLVALLHLLGYLDGYWGEPDQFYLARVVSTFGGAGVDLFFVISGVIMFMIARDNSMPSAEQIGPQFYHSADFLIRRVFRIFPLYWFTLALVVVGGVQSQLVSVHQFLLLSAPPALPVAWTLVYELRFYAIVALAFLLPFRFRANALCLWAFAEFILIAIRGIVFTETDVRFVDSIMLEFAMGVGVGALLEKTRSFIIAKVCFGMAISWFVGASIIVWLYIQGPLTPSDLRLVLYGFPSALLVYSCVALADLYSIRVPHILVLCGNCSYSIYLLHCPVILGMMELWRYHSWIPQILPLACVVAIGLASIVSYFLIELTGIKIGKNVSVNLFAFAATLRESGNAEEERAAK